VNNHNDHAHVVVNPFLVHIGALAVGLLMQWLLPLPFLSVTAGRLAGAVIFLLGLAVGIPASRLMRMARTTFNPGRATTALVTKGPFQRSRNPIYIALLLNYAGLAVFFGTPWSLLLLPVVVWLMNRWVIVPEETYLARKFGNEYAQYSSMVRRWV